MPLQEHCRIEPLDQAHALHASFYTEPHWLEFEQREVFGRSWQLAAHTGELAAPGDHVVGDVAGKPVIIVRQPDGSLQAFFNVCRHRAGPLATCNGKGAKALHCKYHGWTYELDGALRAATEMQDARGFDKSAIGLPRVAVREWHGLVFVALDAATAPFAEVFAGIAERVAPAGLAHMRFAKRDTYRLACNWKVYVDNFLEGYHLPFVHPGLSRVLDYRAYDTELAQWHSLQHSPLRNNAGLYGDGHAWYYFIYPNTMLNITPGRLQTNRILPAGHGHCIVEFDYYYADAPDVQARVQAEQAFSDQIQAEDISICEQVQQGLASGSYSAGRLNPKREGGVWHFQNLLRAAYARRG
ncbi:Rieske 2Fe-2S domain-containing protein [Pseudoduganella sp. DS3]|uniref:Rieske 2Fe-2S domain-containing protein n=1 Tax=Pseudoduganella guangdongensis TaxID=2692179 RepID=A0A6N9HR79_9BURK|nr:aromatic ring-hydroxylating dioxygenase subunit alpha [Pseudoduganella guangdongensis]MYN05422.1 Rieske 2Fe-2S domain-containing protein [Pseudoduganella guangdongensis]